MRNDLDNKDDTKEILPGLEVTPELFFKWRSPRFGIANPELMSNPVWDWLVRSKCSAYQANEHFNGEDALLSGPGWCFDRFGQSSTKLSDGTIVLIGGEHEDYYDADFYIYNDVVLRQPTGKIDIFGYPREVFPPTDFHSATLVGERIIIIGSLSYLDQRRVGFTQVYILDLRDFSISQVQASGTPPGWIHGHEAVLNENGDSIIIRRGLLERGQTGEASVENLDDWGLDLSNWKWERLVERRWRRWVVRRTDRKRNHLWEFRQALWEKQYPQFKTGGEMASASLQEALGTEPDIELFSRLYRPGFPHEALPEVEGEFLVHRFRVEKIVVRYVESNDGIRCTVEGELPDSIIELLIQDLLEKFSALENFPCEALEL